MNKEEIIKLIREELKYKSKNDYRDTEELLYNRKDYEVYIELTKKRIERIKEGCELEFKKNEVESVQGGLIEYKSEIEKREDLIAKLEITIENKKFLIEYIDLALKVVSTNKYYSIVELKYFDGKTNEDIAEILNISVGTVYNQKKRIVSKIKSILFDGNS